MQASSSSAALVGRSLLQAALGTGTGLASLPAPASSAPRYAPLPRQVSKDLESSPKDAEDDVEEKPAVGWALLRMAMGQLSRPGEPSPSSAQQVAGMTNQDCALTREVSGERAFDIADDLEGGMARETSTDFTTPLRRSSKLWRFRVVRSADKMKARLMTDTGDFLMYAELLLNSQVIAFFLYDPAGEGRGLYDASMPTFSMRFNATRTEWRLTQERCEHCCMAPPHLSCARHGKQQLAVIRQSRHAVGDGVSNSMNSIIPGLYTDGNAVVWCPMVGKSDLGMAPSNSLETQHLVTCKPVWNEEVECLVLDFKGRNIVSSAKNFQLALRQKPQHVICQYGKLSDTNFGLDFKYPLSTIQAFSIAMTTIFWT